MTRLGMDPDAVERVGRDLNTSAERVRSTARDIDVLVRRLEVHWDGHDIVEQVASWSSLRKQLTGCADSLSRLSARALDNAVAQRLVSGSLGSGGPVLTTGLFWPSLAPDEPVQPRDNPDPGNLGNYRPFGELPMDDNSISGREVSQGQIGDCWFIAGVGAVATADPQWIRDHIRRNPSGTYTVTLFEKTSDAPVKFIEKQITIEASVVGQSAGDRNENPNFASVYEKALAVEMGGYDRLTGNVGDALERVTGREARNEKDPSLSDIQKGLADGRIYGAGTEDNYRTWWWFDDEVSDTRLVPDHAYMIEKVEERDGRLQVLVRNPWGVDSAQYHGDTKYGEVWLSEEEFHRNFQSVSSVSGG
jgi:uncharacterized protein YukE